MTPRRSHRLAAVATLLLLGLGATACAGSGSDGGDASSESMPAPAGGADGGSTDLDSGGNLAEAEAPADALSYSADRAARTPEQAPQADPALARSLIRTGTVALRADDVDQVRFDVTTLAQGAGGEVSDDQTEADKDGRAERARLTLRVPEDEFTEVLEGLEGVAGAELISIKSATEDVSTQVIDTNVRVELQKRSIERISLLLDRAQSIRAIVGIERELARREADLGSLQQRQAFLADQTSMSTITVAIQRTPEEKKQAEKEKDETGFLAGLEGGWDAFRTVTTGLLTATGAVLPFAVLGLVIGVPLWVFLRRRTPNRRPVAAADATP